MAHLRTELRNHLQTALTGLATPASVSFERAHRLEHADLPAVLVSLTATAIDAGEASMGSPLFDTERDQTVIVELHSIASTGLLCAEEIDQMDLEVEAAMAADLSAGGILEKISPDSSELVFNADQDLIAAVRTVTYIATWRNEFGSPDTSEG